VPDADSYVADFDFSGAFIDGVVIDRDTEQPIAAASVGAQLTDPKATRGGYASAQTSSDGKFRLEVNSGEYRLTARAEGYGVENTTISVGDSGTSGLRLALAHGLTIRGRVVDVAGRGVGGVMVGGRTGEGISLSGGFSRTVADGTFEMSGLIDAAYVLTSQSEGGLFAIAAGVSPGPRAVTLVLRPGGRVRVKVSAAAGGPAAATRLMVSRVQGTLVGGGLGYGETDSTGRAEFATPAGAIELTARGKDGEGKTTVNVPPGGIATAELTMGPAAER
jgi:hypothetical protein